MEEKEDIMESEVCNEYYVEGYNDRKTLQQEKCKDMERMQFKDGQCAYIFSVLRVGIMTLLYPYLYRPFLQASVHGHQDIHS